MAGQDYYDHTTYPSQGSAGSSSAARAEFELVEAGFGKLPDLTLANADRPVFINALGTASEAITADAARSKLGTGTNLWCGTAGGTANALTLTPTPAILAYVAGQRFIFKAGAAANDAATVAAVSGLAAIAVQVNGAACAGGEILANNYYEVIVDASTTSCQLSKIGPAVAATLTSLGVSAFAQTILDDADAATARTTLGAAPLDNPTFTTRATSPGFVPNGSTAPTNGMYLPAVNEVAFSTNSLERARIDANGFLLAGATFGTCHQLRRTTAAPNQVLLVDGNTGFNSVVVFSVDATGNNIANAAMFVGRNVLTSRSINAGGTLNASGADYAEYMHKSANCGTIAKGQIVGITAAGEVTDKWANAIAYMVKSTDPSYVGGDTWGAEEIIGKRPDEPRRNTGDTDQEWAQKETVYAVELDAFNVAMEAARATVDRIAFAGQVPVNVMSATPGHHIIPIQSGGGIAGISVANPTFEQYMASIGRVIAIEADGRARIIVKTA